MKPGVRNGTSSAIDLARKVLRIEADAIASLIDRVGEDFERALDLLFECRGRVIVTGMGKSGIICRKIAATLSSTGTSAWFLHPAEAIHGDLGAIREDDVVLALSQSGETEELLRLLESIRRIGARLIAVTGYPRSTLGRAADVTLDCRNRRGSLPDEPGADREHDRGARARRRARHDAARAQRGSARMHFASFHPGGRTRPPPAARRERDARRRGRPDRQRRRHRCRK